MYYLHYFQLFQFKDNNPVVNKFTDIRVKYEESDNPLVRGARIVTDKVQVIIIYLFVKDFLITDRAIYLSPTCTKFAKN